MLNPNEEVFVVARQSRLKPGGSKFTPNIVFRTDRRRIIIKDPNMLGMREDVVDIPYDMISSVRLDKGVCLHLMLSSKLLDSLTQVVEVS
jgi:hypothetical protein